MKSHYSQKLMKLSAFAATILAIPNNAGAEIVYTDLDPDLFIDGFDCYSGCDFDINGDGVSEISFLGTFSSGGGYYTTLIAGFQNASGQTAGGELAVLSAGDYIGYGSNFVNGGQVLAFDWQAFPYSTSGGPFMGVADAFIGLKFSIGSDTHFGWLRVGDVTDDDMKLLEFAYEDVPGVPIRAGSTCSTPSGLAASLISPSEVALSWNGDSDASIFQLQGGIAGSGVTATKISPTDLKVVGVSPGQTYEWQVRSLCSDGQETLFSNLSTFSVPVLRESELPESSAMSLLSLSPNPTSDILRINFESQKEGEEIIELINLMGRTVYVERVFVNPGENTFKIEVENLPAGIYLTKLGTGEEMIVKKFEILR